jgi:hypothetical protein
MWIEATLSVALLLCVVQLWLLFRVQIDSHSQAPPMGLPQQQPRLIQPFKQPRPPHSTARSAASFVKSRLEVLPKDLLPPRELTGIDLQFNCSHGAEHFERLVKLGKGNTKKAYQARDDERNVTGVLKVPNSGHHAAAAAAAEGDNVYNLSAREFAHVFHIEANMLAKMQHPNLVRLLGACFDSEAPNRVFTFVELLRHWAPSVLRPAIAPQRRVAMARGVAELVRTWNHGTNGLGVPLVHCDFLPQQFGLDDADTVKLLDVEGLRELPSNTSAFFFDIKCDSDAVCRRPGCYKGAAQAQHFRDSGRASTRAPSTRCAATSRRVAALAWV